jgi:hypothetical protein
MKRWENGIWESWTGQIKCSEEGILWLSGPHKDKTCLWQDWAGDKRTWKLIVRHSPDDPHVESDF